MEKQKIRHKTGFFIFLVAGVGIAFAPAGLSYVGRVDSSLRSSPLRGAYGVQTSFAGLSPASECAVPTVPQRVRLK